MTERERQESAKKAIDVLNRYPNYLFGDRPSVSTSEIIELLQIYIPRKLEGDGTGWAMCPNCGTYVEDYHPAYSNRLDGTPQKHCNNCGQALIWEVEIWNERTNERND